MVDSVAPLKGIEGQSRGADVSPSAAAHRSLPLPASGPSFADIQNDALQQRRSSFATDNTGSPDEPPPPSAGEATRLRWAAQQLEALLIHELLKSMRRTVMKTGMFDSPASNMFEEMLDEERANQMAHDGGMGLADLIYEQMSGHLAPEEKDSTDGRNRVRLR